MGAIPSQPPIVVYDSERRGSPFIEELSALVQYRDLLIQLISRNIKARYKRSVLGIAWTMLNPLLTALVLWAVFSNIFVASVDHYPVYILSGIVFWTFFAQTTSSIMTELVWGGSLLNRIYIPKSIFALSALGTSLFNFMIALVPLVVIMIITGAVFSPSLLIVPIAIIILAMFSLGIGLWLSVLAIQFADVIEMYQILLMMWMYLTPIIYPIDVIPEQNRWLFMLNPIYYFLTVFRTPIQDGALPEWHVTAIAFVIALATLMLGIWFFFRKADEIAYRV